MLAAAPSSRQVMQEVAAFTAGCPLVAHNASFDQGFWRAEWELADLTPDPAHEFACTVLLSRRLWPGLSGTTSAAWPSSWAWNGKAGPTVRWPMPPSPPSCCCASSARSRRFAMDLGHAEVDHGLLAHLQRVNVRELRRGLKSYLATVSVP